ncbi:ABC transporter permease [Caballeronia ptereochthonis]|uniref:Aliphatic sulfonates transport permease n=1 Tax=Caballeronia ptereochthonis TaxID=1777144 RepID=A0A158D1H2_9BURK|nr:ABC transporter permease [Caballeronia ptereochthonis]SAK88066.1 aliphatic sulfonates transport permease [Caballeronia ptereochthonis]
MKTAQKLTAPAMQYKSSPSRLKRWFSGNNRDRMISIASPIVLLIVWQILAETGVIDERFFPAPSKVFGTFIALVNDGSLWDNTWATLQRLFWGTLAGGIPALILGVAIGLSRPLRAVFDPLIAATYPVPKSAIFPLLLLICGLGEASKIVMVAIGVFFPVLINTATGVLEINKIYLDVGRNFRASRWQVFRTIALPGAVPHIMSGIKLGIGLGLMLIAIAEMIGSKSGLGYMIWNAWELLSVETMYVGLLVIAALGYGISVVLTELERKLIPWKSSR